MRYKPYEKVITSNVWCACCAIYEPHPFRDKSIKAAVEQSGYTYDAHTGINDDEWCWVFYDWCGNPIGLADERPEGEIVDKFTTENLYDNESLAKYLNTEPFFEKERAHG